MCDKCNKNSCGGCGSSGNSNSANAAEVQSQIDLLQSSVDTLLSLTKFLKGHPILALEDPADIVQFDLTTGKGVGDWIGWGICNGNNYQASATVFIATPNLFDRFLVGSQGTYAVGDTGGSDTVTLITSQIPSHTHAITDPGHTHAITDPGHDHNVTDPGHSHAGSASPHQHTFTTDAVANHHHRYTGVDLNGSSYSLTTGGDWGFNNYDTSDAGAHSHTGLTDMAVTAISVAAAFTGIDMDDSFTGISNQTATTGITIANTGGGGSHENRPPYHAVLFVKKIF